jgi:D-tyrosyl-tRNA(Tyr) deacylase
VLLQRVSRAQVRVADEIVGTIGPGLLLLTAITHDDTVAEINRMAAKVANLRIFDDANGNLNRSALDLLTEDARAISIFVVSQFTLYADTRKGRRPSFVRAAKGGLAAPMVDAFAERFQQDGFTVATGQFGAEMAVELVNEGPVTIWLDSAEV